MGKNENKLIKNVNLINKKCKLSYMYDSTYSSQSMSNIEYGLRLSGYYYINLWVCIFT